MSYTLHHGDCLEAMAAMDAGSVDAVVTDPPYLLGFMGKQWDKPRAAQEWHFAWATFAFRTLRPSCYMVAFGGTRTWHRLACAIEDAGFEIRDTLMWLYGSGFPKGKSCLKPAWEPIILARKPGPMRELGIEECRVETVDNLNGGAYAKNGSPRHDGSENWRYKREGGAGEFEQPAGRWPANLILDEEAGAMLDAQTGTLTSRNGPGGVQTHGETYSGGWSGSVHPGYSGDSGGASRFFYCAKASRSERNAGCEGMPLLPSKTFDGGEFINGNGTPTSKLTAANHHPTVKPLALMRWLVKLVAQPGDVVVDPFMGSGTTGVACAEEGREFIGIEREAEYIEICRRRIEAAAAQGRLPLDESPPLPPVAGRPT